MGTGLILLMTVLPIVIIGFIVMAVVKNDKKGGKDMFKQLYVYLVLFATLMMSIGGGIGIFMGVADLVSPSNMYYEYGSYESYKSGNYEEGSTVNEAQMREDYDQMIEDSKASARQQARNTIINSLGFIIIPLPIFLYFNKSRKKKEEIVE
ncbi:hypothetical protein [Bacillus sp. CECT 9360]|uniref:hypothetical protein n=1 Tax=Bacillus sp. CECT 9360 TaxID=2845821 RepID=UPI001E5A5D13|nr:hypothetical protein [Bacillus sp. CECT 9360]CAH0344207.1 hypothetical protein BCI9360_00449 [Bacillus sp. CECT 9360]